MSSSHLRDNCGGHRRRHRSNIAGKNIPSRSDCIIECMSKNTLKITCDTEKKWVECSLPFTYQGYEYNGCIKRAEEKYWCLVKDKENGLIKANCSKSCSNDVVLATKKISSKQIKRKLKTTPNVASMIEREGDCEKGFGAREMRQVW